MRTPVFLDHQSTTPLDPRVLEAMLPYLRESFGNPASRTHAFGWEAREAVERARASLAGAIGAAPEEIVFTSGATESDNLALGARCATLIVGATEHHAVLDPAAMLEERGVRVERLPVDREGRVDPDDVGRAAPDPASTLLSLMTANNEIGTLHPLGEVGRITRARGMLFHTDAAQALGRVPFDVRELELDLASFSAHKIHGPKGVGALYVRSGVEARLAPTIRGGAQERGLRAGTQSVAGIVGFARAVELALAERTQEGARLAALRDRLLRSLCLGTDGVERNGHPSACLPNQLSVRFRGIDGEALLTALPDVALSTGSACASASRAGSHVLQALGLAPAEARGTVRFGLGRFTSREEVDYAAARVVEEVGTLRGMFQEG